MTAQHTPGPWRIHKESKHDGYAHIEIGTYSLDGDGDYTALAYTQEDAHLIAAAPDLLAALRLCVIRLEALTSGADANLYAAKNAIAKAEGRS